MTPERWQKVKELLGSALEMQPSLRSAYLAEVCAEDASLREDVERLLEAEEKAGPEFLSGVAIAADEEDTEDQHSIWIGRRVGAYEIAEEIGVGGMGEVFRAFRADDQYRKEVAIKLVRVGADAHSIIGRFWNERQILASLDHPNIARMLDGGTTDEGVPYFVMELIAGRPIDEDCNQRRLPIVDRLRLFLQVCAAVQFAHERLIIHRDIKPGNILVGSDGVPKLLDFGIAKILGADADNSKPDATVTLSQALTPAYASPEQVEGRPITTASDVYSLGVVLYELLTGSRPINPRRGPLDDILRQLREGDPIAPSSKVVAQGESGAQLAEGRSTNPHQLASLLRGDVDCIVMKALEKDPSRRYATPAALAEDIGRYLNHEAVLARPSSTAYQVRKYVVRHQIGVAAVSTVVVLLITFGVTEFRQVKHISRERDRADRITQFMTGMFKVSDPSEAKGNTVTAREILDKASNEIESGLSKDAEVRADLMYAMAETYEGLGLYPRAQALLEHAVDIQRGLLGPKDPKYLRSMERLARNMLLRGNLTESEKRLREVLSVQTSVLGPQHPDTLHTMSSVAAVEFYQGHYAEAEKTYRELFTINRQVSGPGAYETLRAMDDLGAVLQTERHYQEAENLQRQTLAIYLRDRKLEDPDTLGAMNNLAITLEGERHFDEAENLFRQALETQRKVLGPDHADTLRSMNNLANVLQLEEHYPEAEQLERDVLDLRRKTLGPEHLQTLTAENNLANTLQMEGRFAEAERLARETLETQQRVLGMQHPDTGYTMVGLALTLTRAGHFARAEDLYRQAVKASSDFGESNLSDMWYEYAHGAMVAGHRNEALQHLRKAIENGYTDIDNLTSEKDFNPLRGDPQFEALLADLNKRASDQASKGK